MIQKYIITLDVACAIVIDSGVSVDGVASVDNVRGGCFGVLITWKIIRLKKFYFKKRSTGLRGHLGVFQFQGKR